MFEKILESFKIPATVKEYKFHPSRKWKFDYAWPEYKVALEQEGGIFGTGKPCPMCKRKGVGAHTSIERLLGDMEKYNNAAALGWRIIRVTPDDLMKTKTFELLKQILNQK